MNVVIIIISTIFLYAITINGYPRNYQIKSYDKSNIELPHDYNTGRRTTHEIRRTILTPIKRTYKFYKISKSNNIRDNQETSDIHFKLSRDGIVNALKPKKKHYYHIKITSREKDDGNYLNEAPATIPSEKYTVETTKHGIGSTYEISGNNKDGNNLVNSNKTKQIIDIINTEKSSDVSKNRIESSNLNQIKFNLSIPTKYETQSEVHAPKTSGIVNKTEILKILKNLHDNLSNQDYARSVTLSTNVLLNNENIGNLRNIEEKQSIYRDIENGDENKNITKSYNTEQTQGKKFNDKNDVGQNAFNSNVRIENIESSPSEKKLLGENQIKPKLNYIEQKEKVKLNTKHIIHRNLTEKSFDNNKALISDSNSKIKHKTNLGQEFEENGTFNENFNITILSNDSTDQDVIKESFRNSAAERIDHAKYTNNKEQGGPADIERIINSQKYFNEKERTDNTLPRNEKKLFDVVKGIKETFLYKFKKIIDEVHFIDHEMVDILKLFQNKVITVIRPNIIKNMEQAIMIPIRVLNLYQSNRYLNYLLQQFYNFSEIYTGFVPNNHVRQYNENYYYIQPQNTFHGLHSSYNYYDYQPKKENIGWKIVPNEFLLRIQNENNPRYETAAKRNLDKVLEDYNLKLSPQMASLSSDLNKSNAGVVDKLKSDYSGHVTESATAFDDVQPIKVQNKKNAKGKSTATSSGIPALAKYYVRHSPEMALLSWPLSQSSADVEDTLKSDYSGHVTGNTIVSDDAQLIKIQNENTVKGKLAAKSNLIPVLEEYNIRHFPKMASVSHDWSKSSADVKDTLKSDYSGHVTEIATAFDNVQPIKVQNEKTAKGISAANSNLILVLAKYYERHSPEMALLSRDLSKNSADVIDLLRSYFKDHDKKIQAITDDVQHAEIAKASDMKSHYSSKIIQNKLTSGDLTINTMRSYNDLLSNSNVPGARQNSIMLYNSNLRDKSSVPRKIKYRYGMGRPKMNYNHFDSNEYSNTQDLLTRHKEDFKDDLENILYKYYMYHSKEVNEIMLTLKYNEKLILETFLKFVSNCNDDILYQKCLDKGVNNIHRLAENNSIEDEFGELSKFISNGEKVKHLTDYLQIHKTRMCETLTKILKAQLLIRDELRDLEYKDYISKRDYILIKRNYNVDDILEQFGDQNVEEALLLKLSAKEDKDTKNLAEFLRNHEIDIKRSFNALINDQHKILIYLEELTSFCVNENLTRLFQRFVPKALINFYK